MDPNEVLRRALKARKAAEEAADGDSNDAEIRAWQEYGEHTDALFTHLSNGGWPPLWQTIAAEVLG